MKKFRTHRTLCPILIGFMSDIFLYVAGHIAYYQSIILIFSSDIMSKTSDMSGCPTTFHIHCVCVAGGISSFQFIIFYPEFPNTKLLAI